MTGIVQFFDADRGYGFVKPLIGKPEDTTLIYCHVTAFRRTNGQRPAPPPIGAELRFDVCRGERGPQCANVELVLRPLPQQVER